MELFTEYKNKTDEEIENFVKNLTFSKENKILNIAHTLFILDIFCLFKILKINPFFSRQLITPKNESEKEILFNNNNLYRFLKLSFEIKEELEDDRFENNVISQIHLIKEKNLVILIFDFQIRFYDINDINFNNCIYLINLKKKFIDTVRRTYKKIKKFLMLNNGLISLYLANDSFCCIDDSNCNDRYIMKIIDDYNENNINDYINENICLNKLDYNSLNKPVNSHFIIPHIFKKLDICINYLDIIDSNNLICVGYKYNQNDYIYIIKEANNDLFLRLKINLNHELKVGNCHFTIIFNKFIN